MKQASKSTRGLRAALIAVCAGGALLAAGFGIGIAGWKRATDSLAGADAQIADGRRERQKIQRTLSDTQSQLHDTQSQLAAVQDHASALEASLAQAEQRASAAESDSRRLEEEKSALQAELDQLKKKASASSAAPSPSSSPSVSSSPAPSIPDSAKLIALTFDDGPGDTTARLLDELKKRGMKATFFVVGNRVGRYADTLKRAAEEGHEIGTHTYSHPNLTKLSRAEKAEEIQSSIQAIQNITGKPVTLLRPPGGSYDDDLKAYCREQDLRILYWSVDTRDWESRSKSSILTTAFQDGPYGIRDGAIVLMHDIYSSTVDAAVEMMDRLQKDGYTTVTVSELLQLRCGGGAAGEVYVCAPPK